MSDRGLSQSRPRRRTVTILLPRAGWDLFFRGLSQFRCTKMLPLSVLDYLSIFNAKR